MAGDGSVRYDGSGGAEAADAVDRALATVSDAEVSSGGTGPDWSIAAGSGRGTAFDVFVAAFDRYRGEVNDRLGEDRRVGGSVSAMMAALHARMVPEVLASGPS